MWALRLEAAVKEMGTRMNRDIDECGRKGNKRGTPANFPGDRYEDKTSTAWKEISNIITCDDAGADAAMNSD